MLTREEELSECPPPPKFLAWAYPRPQIVSLERHPRGIRQCRLALVHNQTPLSVIGSGIKSVPVTNTQAGILYRTARSDGAGREQCSSLSHTEVAQSTAVS